MFSTHNEQGLLEQRVFRAAVKQEDMMVICNAPDEQRLLLALRQQPEQGLAAAIEQYGGLVQAVIRRTLGAARPQDVEECTSEVFWRFYQNAANFQPGRSLKSYLCGIARHVAIDRLRQLGRTDWLQLPQDENALGVWADPADELAAADRQQLVQQCVDSLPQPDRDIFILRYYFGERVNAIASRLGLEAKAVENRLYQWRLRLKKALVERGIEL